jgi:hypothetical protein
MTNWMDPETLWLNVINALLGLVTAGMLMVVAGVAVHDLLLKWRTEHGEARAPEQEAWFAPALGLTMADGGEKVAEKEKEEKQKKEEMSESAERR